MHTQTSEKRKSFSISYGAIYVLAIAAWSLSYAGEEIPLTSQLGRSVTAQISWSTIYPWYQSSVSSLPVLQRSSSSPATLPPSSMNAQQAVPSSVAFISPASSISSTSSVSSASSVIFIPFASTSSSSQQTTSVSSTSLTSSSAGYCGDAITQLALGEECDDGSHCADGTFCTYTKSCDDGSSCIPRAEYGQERCTETCRAVGPMKCCQCYFDQVPSCYSKSNAMCEIPACRDGIDNDGDGKIDSADPECSNATAFGGIMNDDSEELAGDQQLECVLRDGYCIGFFADLCKRDMEQNGCDEQSSYEYGYDNDGQPRIFPFNNVCTETSIFVRRHSSSEQCAEFSTLVQLCMQCNSAACQNYSHGSCSTFANEAAALAEAEKIREQLRMLGIRTVVVSGNQTASSTTCTTFVNFTITEEAIETSYEPCHFGDFCFRQGEHFRCDDGNGPVDGSCCRNPDTTNQNLYLRTQGATCPEPPSNTGVCSGQGSGWRCSPEATSAAWWNANVSCASAEQQCHADHPYGNFQRVCNGRKVAESWLPLSCTWSVDCTWTCLW